MILTDFSQICLANLHIQIKATEDSPSTEVNPDLLRHMILNSLRKYNRQFSKKYGDMIICSDNINYWRKSVFTYYKANRKKRRDDSGIDWPLVTQTFETLRNDIRETFPYKVINVPDAEADDIIGVLAKAFHQDEPILILSGDHDFLQLQIYPNVEQYSTVKEKFLTTPDPVAFLKEHIIRGDEGDGVPNFLSPDNSFVDKIKQQSIFKAKVEVWLTQNVEDFCTETTLLNYRRNEMLVDLGKIPVDVESAILEEFEKPIVGGRAKIFSYLVKHRLTDLIESIREF